MGALPVLKAAKVAILALLVTAAFGQDDAKAQKYILRSLSGEYRTNVVTIIKQRDWSDGGYKTVKLQRSAEGKIKESILAPMHSQNEFLDDLKERRFYSPDKRRLVILGPSSATQDLKMRQSLIAKNYNLKLEASRKVAGRSCVVVTAMAKNSQLSDIRYSFDEKTGYPMAKEIIRPSGTVIVDFETVDAWFPKQIDASTFKIEPVAGVEVVRVGEPKYVSGIGEASQALGFSPIIPSKIPLGFQVQKMWVSSTYGVPTLFISLTDGLQRLSVSEWIPKPKEEIISGEDVMVIVNRGIKIAVVADMDGSFKESFLHSFLASLHQDLGPLVTRVGI